MIEPDDFVLLCGACDKPYRARNIATRCPICDGDPIPVAQVNQVVTPEILQRHGLTHTHGVPFYVDQVVDGKVVKTNVVEYPPEPPKPNRHQRRAMAKLKGK